jgi:DNA-binding XRE family transcriptional regulator
MVSAQRSSVEMTDDFFYIHSMTSVEFGKSVRRARLKHGLTQQQLAEQIGLSRATLISIEQGKTWSKYDKITRLCQILKIRG